MRTGGLRVECDRCGATCFAALLEEQPKSTDGGYTTWMERSFEDLPDGWTRGTFYGSVIDYVDLCPSCTAELAAAQREFMGGGADVRADAQRQGSQGSRAVQR